MAAWNRIVLHADMDAFYAAVEQRDNPELRGRPILVGPQGQRGVVLTASYEARAYGVGSAMPIAEARRRCPQAITVSPRFDQYQAISQQVMDTFADFSPHVEAISLDEAFLEMTGATHFFGQPREMATRLKLAVKEATGLNISVGASGTKYVAKVASAHDKPDGITIVPPDEAVAWLAPLPVARLWGVGRKTTPKLEALGYYTIGDIATAEPAYLSQQLGSQGQHFHNLANAQDPRRVLRGRAARSIGSDRTLSKDVFRRADILRHLSRSADRIARRLRAKHYVAGGIRVRLKTSKFEMLTRQRKLARPSSTAADFMKIAASLLEEFPPSGPFRLVGMAAFDLNWDTDPEQLDLFAREQPRTLEATLDCVVDKFGTDAILRARDLQGHGSVMKNGVNLDYLDYRDGERVTSPAGAEPNPT